MKSKSTEELVEICKENDREKWSDEELEAGDGAETEFQLVKIYSSGGNDFSRKITKPVSGTVTVYIGSVEQFDPADYTIDLTTGIITFDSAPGSGEVVTATFEFDIPVRFDTDYLPVSFSTYQARAADVPILEIRV